MQGASDGGMYHTLTPLFGQLNFSGLRKLGELVHPAGVRCVGVRACTWGCDERQIE
jgi:hypothetical protein